MPSPRPAAVPFSCYKYVTDLADENATANWRDNVARGAGLFVAALKNGTLDAG